MNATAPREYMPLSVQRRNLIFIVIDGVAIGLMSAAASFVSVFVIRLGASPVWVSLLSSIPSAIGFWKAFLPEMSPIPPARLLMTAVRTACARSFLPEAPPELIMPTRPI